MCAQLGNALTAMRRLSQYLILEERIDDVEKLERPGAVIQGASFFWAEPPVVVVRPLHEPGGRSPLMTHVTGLHATPCMLPVHQM